MKLITSDLPSLAVDLYKTPILATITQFVHDEVKKSDANKRLNDKAMTDYVKSYMDELAAKQVEPLKKKIKLLEQQLHDKASR
jgi:phosphoserine phosphatase